MSSGKDGELWEVIEEGGKGREVEEGLSTLKD